MKKPFLTAIILIFCYSIFSQNSLRDSIQTLPYKPLIIEGNEWRQIFVDFDDIRLTKWVLMGDSVIEGKIYKQMKEDTSYLLPPVFFLWEDTLSRKVYVRVWVQTNPDIYMDKIAYDYGMQIGDTIELADEFSALTHVRLDSIGITYIVNNEPRRIFFLSFMLVKSAQPGVVWIEGMGNLAGIDKVNFGNPQLSNPYIEDFYLELSCFFSEGQLLYHSWYGGDILNLCDSSFVLKSDNAIQSSSNGIYPNPAIDWVHIPVEDNKNIIVYFYSALGGAEKRVLNQKRELNISDMENGLYYYRIMDESNHEYHRGKLLKLK